MLTQLILLEWIILCILMHLFELTVFLALLFSSFSSWASYANLLLPLLCFFPPCWRDCLTLELVTWSTANGSLDCSNDSIVTAQCFIDIITHEMKVLFTLEWILFECKHMCSTRSTFFFTWNRSLRMLICFALLNKVTMMQVEEKEKKSLLS